MQILRIKPNFTDDPDYVALQIPADGSIDGNINRGTVPAAYIALVFLNISNEVVPGGTASIQFIEASKLRGEGPMPQRIVLGSTVFASTPSLRKIVIDEVSNQSVLGVRITSVSAPATATKMALIGRGIR